MKRITFILSFVLISILSTCNAQTYRTSSSATARQFGYYVAHGDAVKASLNVTPESDITLYVKGLKSEIDDLGGLNTVKIENEEYINDNEVKITVIYVCKKEDATVKRTYTLLKVDNSWKIEMDKL